MGSDTIDSSSTVPVISSRIKYLPVNIIFNDDGKLIRIIAVYYPK